MSRNRLFLVVAMLAAVVVVAGGFFLGVQPQLAAASDNDKQRVAIEQRNQQARVELAKLREENKTLDAQKQALAALQASVPSTVSTAGFYRELNAVAAASGVTISSITTADPAAYTSPEGPSDDASTSAGNDAAPMPATDATVTATNFSTIAVSVGVTGSFDQARAFLKGVQTGERLFLVTNITSSAETSGEESSASTWTFGGTIYVLSGDPSAGTTTAPSPSASPEPEG